MMRKCSVCTHKDIEEINRKLIDQTDSFRTLSVYGLPETALKRHKSLHIVKVMAAGKQVFYFSRNRT
jgi:hypothetical protein